MSILLKIPSLPLPFAEGLNAAETDLGGGAPVGAEPDIFADVDSDAGADAGDSDVQDDAEVAEGDSDGASDGADSGADSSEAAEGDEGDEQAESESEEDQGSAEEEEVKEDTGADEGKNKPAAPAQKKPLTDAEKEVEKTLQEVYRENPKVREFLKANPDQRPMFFKAAKMNQLYPTIKEAEQAKEWSMALFNIDKLYYGNTPESKRDFLKLLWDENLDSTGKSTGHYEQVQEMFTADTLSQVEAVIAQNPQIAETVTAGFKPEQARVAVEVVRRLISAAIGRPLNAGRGAGPVEQPTGAVAELPKDASTWTPRERALYEENQRYKNAEQAATTRAAQEAETTFYKSTYDSFYSGIKGDIDKRLPGSVQGNVWLSEKFTQDVITEIHKELKADSFFDAQLEAAARSGSRDQQHVQQLADMMKQRAVLLIPTIAKRVAGKITSKPAASRSSVNNQGQRTNRQGTRTGSPRREPALGGTPGRLSKPTARTSNTPGRQSGMKSTGDYNRDADRILEIE